MFSIKIYSSLFKREWDDFVLNAKNFHFMFFRDYMDYHSHKFVDLSLMIFDGKKLAAVFPANIYESVCYSHQGLTFGGLIVGNAVKSRDTLDIFNEIKLFLKSQRVDKLVYKVMPYIYYKRPSEDDKYALFILNAQLVRRDISSSIYLANKIKLSDSRKNTINKAKKFGLKVVEEHSFESFWILLNKVLFEKHNTLSVHSIDEIKLLVDRFPENIKLFIAVDDCDQLYAGCVVYINDDVVHTKYLASSDEGRTIGALDYVLNYLIEEQFKNKKIFDFGVSTENNGRYLNEGLIFQKEGFGARGVVHDFYEIVI